MFAFRKREKLSLLDNCLRHTIDVINYSVFGDFDRTAKTMVDEWWRSSEKWKASKVYRQMPMPSFKSFQEAQKNVNAIWNSKKKSSYLIHHDKLTAPHPIVWWIHCTQTMLPKALDWGVGKMVEQKDARQQWKCELHICGCFDVTQIA